MATIEETIDEIVEAQRLLISKGGGKAHWDSAYEFPLSPVASGFLFTDANGKLSWNTSSSNPHDFLSVTHTDTLAAAVVRGDIIVGNGTPKWSRFAIGADKTVFQSNGSDPVWQANLDIGSGSIISGAITATGDITASDATIITRMNLTNTAVAFRVIHTVQNSALNGGILTIRAHGASYSETLLSNSMTSNTLLMADDGALIIGTFTSERIVFGTNNAEDMRILPNGNILMGTTVDQGQKLIVNGQLRVVQGIQTDLGTGPAPTWTFNTDTDTGMFRVTTDTLGFTTAGSEKMRILPGGNVLIGTTVDQGEKLIVNGQLRVVQGIQTDVGTGAAPTWTFNVDTNTGMFRVTTDILGFTTAGVEAMRIIANGNVGIGGSPGSFRLHVIGGNTRIAATGAEQNLLGLDKLIGFNDLRFYTDDVGTTLQMIIFGGGNISMGTSVDSGDQLNVNGSVRVVGAVKVDGGTAAAPTLTFHVDTNTGIFRVTTDTLGFTTAGGENMRMLPGGNILIGTTVDQGDLLNVNGALRVGGGIKNDLGTAVAPTYTFGADTNVGMYRVTTDVLGLTAGGVERMRLDSTGADVALALRAQVLRADGDVAGIAGTVTFTNAKVAVGVAQTIQHFRIGAALATHDTWLRIKDGTVTKYIPVFVNF